ncbi:MAG: CoA-binding protein, partial [Firmicutes bacterium]|nr:CoA-binding protein [Bacillota bacterium]
AYGIPVSPILRARTEDEAINISERLGYPVAMKISSHHIIHKTDVGGVKLGLYNKKEVGKAYGNMLRRVKHFLPDAPIYGVEIQKMVGEGIELIIGMTRDIQFGPLIAFGLGGIYVNLLEDVAFSLAAVLKDPDEIENLIRKTRVYSLLRGYRGSKPADVKAVMDTIARVASLAMDFEEIVEMDINPLRAFEKGVSALDIKITINPHWD